MAGGRLGEQSEGGIDDRGGESQGVGRGAREAPVPRHSSRRGRARERRRRRRRGGAREAREARSRARQGVRRRARRSHRGEPRRCTSPRLWARNVPPRTARGDSSRAEWRVHARAAPHGRGQIPHVPAPRAVTPGADAGGISAARAHVRSAPRITSCAPGRVASIGSVSGVALRHAGRDARGAAQGVVRLTRAIAQRKVPLRLAMRPRRCVPRRG